jgi:uncharacterized protein (TIGR03067 family)
MRIATGVLVVSAAGLLGAGDDAKKKDDAELLKGKWSAVSFTVGKMSQPDDFIKSFKFTFDGKKYTNVLGSEVAEEGEYKIDSSKSPKTMDFDIKTGRDMGKKQFAIYKFEGEKLTIVAAAAGSEERPKSFTVEADSQTLEIVLEKDKS